MIDTTLPPQLTIGIEEEYLLVDPATGALTAAPDALLADLTAALGDRISTEFLTCQIEVGTGICDTISDARADLGHLRRTVAQVAGRHGLAPIAASCHPWGDWTVQDRTAKARYDQLDTDLGAVARRMLIGGMHVHVGIPDPDTRIAIMNRLGDLLPVLLALSGSSPFWQSADTGLSSWRVSVFDGMPRTGLPPRFADWADYTQATSALTGVGVIEDTSKLWWDLRPSHTFATLEVRICDVSPRMEDALTIAALVQAATRMIWRGLRDGTAWPTHRPLIASENRWRAQRYGVTEGLIAPDGAAMVPMADVVATLLADIAADTQHLGSGAEAAAAGRIVAQGNSADRQRAIHAAAVDAGADPQAALLAVVQGLIADFMP